ncbi:hypothetical protein ILYODFUR_028713 [Ilyodon furcidens]|uniref:Uncharacterized protein n=1 Tax=Ilyodon furcidens TaxID=33524 RepID=A0ABV0TNN9_9TELE
MWDTILFRLEIFTKLNTVSLSQSHSSILLPLTVVHVFTLQAGNGETSLEVHAAALPLPVSISGGFWTPRTTFLFGFRVYVIWKLCRKTKHQSGSFPFMSCCHSLLVNDHFLSFYISSATKSLFNYSCSYLTKEKQ